MRPADDTARVVVFDGLCPLCSGWARFLAGHPVDPPYLLLPMQSIAGKTLLVDHGIDPEDPLTFLLVDRGRAWTQSDAVIRVVAALGGPWLAIHLLRLAPRVVRDAAYRWIARNRYRWFGRRRTCQLPP